MNLARKVIPHRLAAACRLTDSYGKYNYLDIQYLLKTKSELIEVPEETVEVPERKYTRKRLL